MGHIEVKEVVRETRDAITLVLAPVGEGWRYRAGQFITLRCYVGRRYVERCYSFCTAPGIDRYPAITVKRLEGGVVSGYLHAFARPGMVLEALPPAGRFGLPPVTGGGRQLVFVGGGSGITPLFAMLKAALVGEPATRVWVIDANRSEEDIIYRDALEALQRVYPRRLEVIHVLSQPSDSWEGRRGRLTRSMLWSCLAGLEEGVEVDYFLCAPAGLMEVVYEGLTAWGVDRAHIHRELFTPPARKEEEAPFRYRLQVVHRGRTYVCHPSGGQTLWEACQEVGVEIPYACKRGTCNTCRARCVEGGVVMDEDEGLSEAEVKEGYVLTCVARPRTKEVKIEV